MLSWIVCPSCGSVGLVFDSEEEENAFRQSNLKLSEHKYASTFGACNICSNFTCQYCLTDYKGKSREWCTKCDRETDPEEPPFTTNHPDLRRSIGPFFFHQ